MKYLKKACSLVSGVICFCMLVLGIGMILGYLLGFRFLAVTTGSMKEVYDVGTLVVADKVSPDEIETGDIISYVTDDALTVVTHRVIAVDSENRCFYTKGDSNNVADSRPVVFENLIGKVRFGIPVLGYLVIFAKKQSWANYPSGNCYFNCIFCDSAVDLSQNAEKKKKGKGKQG